jgi:plastocyanin
MGSGLGIPFEPPMDMLQAGMQMVASNPNDPVMIPANMAPLQAVFASSSSTLLNNPMDYQPLDFEALRLDPATFDRTVKVRAQAETMLKESQWAHNFADAHFGAPSGDFGAQQRFMGLMVNMLAQMQGQYAMQNLLRDDGLYYDSDGTLDYTGNWVTLHVLSDLAGLAGEEGGRYANSDMAPMFDMAASNLMTALESRRPGTPQEAAAAIRALQYRAFTASDTALKYSALARAKTLADGLTGLKTDDVVETSAAIAGLIAQSTVDENGSYRETSDKLFAKLMDDFDAKNGVFESKNAYNVDDVAWIIGGLNSLTQQGNDATKGPASKMLLAFYESTISVAGLQLSAPPGKDGAMAGAFEKQLPSVVFYHPANTPAPPEAGKLTVPAEAITSNGSSWSVTSDRFVTAGAMHLANELNWLGPHLGSIPFPFQATDAPSQSTAPVPTTAAASPSTQLTLTAKNIAFSTTKLEVPAGKDVTITYENQDNAVPHNLHIQAGAAGDFKTEIVAGPTQQTLTFNISQPGTYTFVCDVHPAQMTGTLVVK